MRTPTLLIAVILVATAHLTRAVSPKACRRKALKSAQKYIDCFLRAEDKSAKPKRFNKCEKNFRKNYKKVLDLDGCTNKVLGKPRDVVFSIEANCLSAGYDGSYCSTVAESSIDVTSEPPELIGCTEEALVCPNGDDFAVRDNLRQCDFTPCCCDPAKEPGKFGNPIGREGYVCCPNGEWTTNNLGDGKTYFCESEEPSIGSTGPFGRRCRTSGPSKLLPEETPECDPEEQPGMNGNPDCGVAGFGCCPDGQWKCGVSDGITASFSCEDDLPPFMSGEGEEGGELPGDGENGANTPGSTGDNCDPMLEPGQFDNPICTDLYACCPNGEWSCGIGDGTIPCE